MVVANVDQIKTVIIEVSYMGKSLGVIKINKSNENWTVEEIKTMIVFATFGKNGYLAPLPLVENGEEEWKKPDITAPDPYTLAGWYTDPDFNEEYTTESFGSAPDKTIVLYAKLIVEVNFDENNDDASGDMENQTFIYNKAQKLTKMSSQNPTILLLVGILLLMEAELSMQIKRLCLTLQMS